MIKFPDFLIALRQRWKTILFVAAVTIGSGSLWYTGDLVTQLSSEEQNKVELWAEATRRLSETVQQNTDIEFILKVVENNNTVPVILTDSTGNIISYRNFFSSRADDPEYIRGELESMKKLHAPIVVALGGKNFNFIYYKESLIIKKLTIYPYVQLSVIIVFILLSYIAFSSARRAEQNKVWLGLSRETAHQLGTPTSSLMAWIELLRDKLEDSTIIDELEKDVNRLNVVTERFSKIGSQPKLDSLDVSKLVNDVSEYMRRRMSNSVKLTISVDISNPFAPVNKDLLGWVIENLLKNSLDAIVIPGRISVVLSETERYIIIDVQDSGKGIPKRNFKRVFKPGFTTKTRGWGLGLSLARRIIEEYHKGKIFVLTSELGVGCCFRILLPKS